MPDLAHTFGQDLQVSATGDLLLSSGAQMSQERVLRRLLTNRRDYIWQLAYGAGIGAAVGRPANAPRLKAVIRAQMLRERGVARAPAPTVDVVQLANNTVVATLKYADAATGSTNTLSLPIS